MNTRTEGLVAQKALEVLAQSAHAEPLGLYLHIPFCQSRCSYCSFTSFADQSPLRARFVPSLVERIQAWGTLLGQPAVDTLYLGGGTPSLLSLAELESLLIQLRRSFSFAPLKEATLEVNPGTVSAEWLLESRRLGFDRVSMGIQSLDNGLLQSLGRIHDAQTALCSLQEAKTAGFERISADLMIGAPGQVLENVLSDARTLVDAGATHLSIYMLDLDKACPLKRQVESGSLALPSDEDIADIYEALQDYLPELGLFPYEISNYAQYGQEALHNCRYWERRPYLGLGPSAASQLADYRWTEPSDLDAWLASQPREVCDWEPLSPSEALAEIPLLGLRMHRGVDWEHLRNLAEQQNLLPVFLYWEKQLTPCFHYGLLTRVGNRLQLTKKGMLLSNAVLRTFI